MLTAEQIDAYRATGFILVEDALSREMLREVCALIDDYVAKARSVERSDAVYDLEDTHTPEAPRVRRLKNPVDLDPFFWTLLRDPAVIGPVIELIGPDLRLHGSKINMKSPAYGAAVEWHQDWAFYPHTNDDLLAVGIMLDDVTAENGPLMIVPESHRGPVRDHHSRGCFTGAIDVAAEGLDLSRAATLTGSAGSMSIHHVRAIHGSALNRSSRPRRMLFYEIAAADSWPLWTDMRNYRDFDHFEQRMIVGKSTLVPRTRAAPVRMPVPLERAPESIYQLQQGAAHRYFEVHAEERRAG